MRFTRILLLFLILVWTSGTVYAGRAFYLSLELAGIGGVGSVNAEQIFFQQGPWRLGWRAGFSLAPIDSNNGTGLIFPLMIQTSWGSPVHWIEAGVGQAFTLTTKGKMFVRMPLSLAYRWEPSGRRFFLRAAYTPLVSYLFDWQLQHWAGITWGYRMGGNHE